MASSAFVRQQLLLDSFEVGVHLWVLRPQRFHSPHGAHHRGVVAIAERAAELRKAALEALAAQVHGDLASESHAAVAILAQEFGIGQSEVAAHGLLNVFDADALRPLRSHAGELAFREVEIDRSSR